MMNKYTYWRSLTALMLVMVGVCACTDELDGLGVDSTRPSDVICFTASLSDTRSASLTRSASGHLEIEQEEWLVGTEQSVTRGTPVTLLEGSAGVIGYVYETWSEGTTKPLTDLYNKQFNFDGDELTAASDNVRWNTLNKPNVRFYVYAPYDLKNDGKLSSENQGGSPQLTYTVDKTPANQHDLIVASWEGESTYKQSIPLVFNHALTAVRFKIGFDCTVKSLKVNGVCNNGTYTFGKGWTNIQTTEDYTFTFGKNGSGQSFAANAFLTDGKNTLMMIPQKLSSSAKVILTYIEDGTEKTITSTISGKVWQAGKMITYTIHKDEAPTTIYFDLAAGNVDIQPATSDTIKKYNDYLDGVKKNDIIYIGSVYVNGGSVRYAGKHDEKNRYYVYQSSEADEKRNTKTHTGYATKDDFANRGNVECRIPSYAPVKYNDQLWSDYITNNTNVQEVIEAWDNAAGAGQATENKVDNVSPNQTGADGAVRKVGREATKNRIHITGNVGAVNLSIDNIYSSYQERETAGSDEAVRSRKYGGISFLPSETAGNSTLTINIMGDNRLGCVNYQNNKDIRNWLVFEGTGSLTVADTDYYWKNGTNVRLGSNRSCSVIGGKDSPESADDVYNIKFNSGIIYAGATLSSCTAIGGGGNGCTTIIINGGTITAVAKTTGTAIGGGTGLTYEGGIGNVTITGGNIYAYNYKNTSKVPSSAIGGAGSQNEEGSLGNVNISGGYVYAYSEFGTAIGGGSSAYTWGGDADITITGGQVIAVSDDGAGIGGGSACTNGKRKSSDDGSKPSYHGGTAIIRINEETGMPIIRTGSIGGGTSKDPGVDKTKGTEDDGRIGSADITIEGGDIQAQFVMAAGSKGEPIFKMSGGTIRNSYVDDEEYIHIKKQGGAIYLEDGTFIMSGGTIKNCSAEQGGAVYVNSQSGNSTFTMTGGEIHSCFATGTYNNSTLTNHGHGGAVCLLGGQVNMSGGRIWNNYSENGNGGAIYISNGNFAMNNGMPEISANAAHKGNGGGVFVSSENGKSVKVDLLQGIITNNTANNYGGGICVDMGDTKNSATVTVGANGQGVTESDANPKIYGNMAMMSGGGLYVRGTNANVTINSGMIDNNKVSAYVKNEDVTNEMGGVTLNAGLVTHVVVTFDGNGGTFNNATTTYTQNIVTNTNSKLAPNRFVRAGYRFNGWNTRADGLGDSYSEGDAKPHSSNITLYAQWVAQ